MKISDVSVFGYMQLRKGILLRSLMLFGVLLFTFSTTSRGLEDGHISVFGWNGDRNAALAYRDGSFGIRIRGDDATKDNVGFGIYNNPASMKWYLESGYLPALVTEFERNGCTVKITNFGDSVTIGGNAYVAAYSRVSVYNHSQIQVTMDPLPSAALIVLNAPGTIVQPGQTKTFDYVIAIDRFGNSYTWPTPTALKNCQTYDRAYTHMANYWNNKLAAIANITVLPDQRLIEAYKAGYVYTHIIKDGVNLNVGENVYDCVYDHDALGILSTLLVLGDFNQARDLLAAIPVYNGFYDAKWKFNWPFALYMLKTDDLSPASNRANDLSTSARSIAQDRTGPNGVMCLTDATDADGYWTIDNWSALFGLLAYKYTSERRGNTVEADWAAAQYTDLLAAVDVTISETMDCYGLSYLPASPVAPNTQNRAQEYNDANWASHLLFGRWAWDGFLLNGAQYGANLTKIDETYDYGFGRIGNRLPRYDFGGYPGYSSAYNAGYGAAALRGERWRDVGIKAYQMMIDSAMSAPYGWWEGIVSPATSSWEGTHTPKGNGSCPHMWGQSVATKVLIESIIAEKYDETIIIGRGIPNEWLKTGAGAIAIENVPIAHNKRMGVRIEGFSDHAVINFSGAMPAGNIWIDLPLFITNQITNASTGSIDNPNHRVIVPGNTSSVTVYWQGTIPGPSMWPGYQMNTNVEFRIKSRLTDHGIQYLFDNGDAIAYGSTPSNNTYVWVVEKSNDGWFKIRNKATGDYMHIQNDLSYVEASSADPNWESKDWRFTLLTQESENIVRVQNRWRSDKVVHVENQTGFAQSGVLPDGYWSAMWIFETVPQYCQIQSRSVEGGSKYLHARGDSVVGYGNVPSGDLYLWTIESMNGFKQLRNKATNCYMNIEDTLTNYVRCTSILSGWHSKDWVFTNAPEGSTYIKCRWDKHPDYLHVQNRAGYLEHKSTIDTGLLSAQWRIIPHYTLTLVASNGTITLNPPGGIYASGTVVTLKATPNSGYTFTNWSGDLSGTIDSASITMNGNKSVTANFGAVPSNVSILGSWVKGATHAKEPGANRALVVMLYGEGSKSISASTVKYGEQAMTFVTEKSYLNSAYSYTGAFILKETGVAAATSGSITVTWSSAPTSGSEIVSVFLKDVNQSSSIGATATGSINGITVTTSALATSAGDMVLEAGTAANNGTYTINNGFTRGIPETSASFGDITSAFKPATGANETPSLTHSLSQRQTSVGFVVKKSTAAPVQFTLGTIANNGKITPNPTGGTYASGTVVTVAATPNTGYKFTNWSGDLSGTINSTTITMNSNKSITANFSAIPRYTLAANPGLNGKIMLNPTGGAYDSGAVVSLAATANSGYVFSAWSGDLSGSNNPATLTMNSNKSVTATFSLPSSNLVKNGDFSNGMTGWVFTVTNPSTGSGSAVSGQFCADITNDDGTNWHLQLYQGGISLENGKSCTITFDAKAQSSRSIVVQVKDSSGASRCWATPTISTTMQKYTVTFTNAGATGSNYQLLFFLGAAGANDVWLDNVQLTGN